VGVRPAGLLVGTAGWSIPSRYASETPGAGSHLERYSRVLDAVEINSSFHRPHQRKTYERWAGATPDGFRFSVKVPRAMTHERSLADCGDLIGAFAGEVGGLGGKLAALLVQLPASAAPELTVAGRFFKDLSAAVDAAIVFEPRHPGWFTSAADAWLAERRIARVAADPARPQGAGEPGGWPNLRYYRWHGSPRIYYSDYDEAALVALKARADADRAGGAVVWCVFDNTASGAALGDALAFAGL